MRNFQEIGGELYEEFGDLRLDGLRIAIYIEQVTRLLKP